VARSGGQQVCSSALTLPFLAEEHLLPALLPVPGKTCEAILGQAVKTRVEAGQICRPSAQSVSATIWFIYCVFSGWKNRFERAMAANKT